MALKLNLAEEAYIIIFVNSLKQSFSYIFRIFRHRAAEKRVFVGECYQHEPSSISCRHELRLKT